MLRRRIVLSDTRIVQFSFGFRVFL